MRNKILSPRWIKSLCCLASLLQWGWRDLPQIAHCSAETDLGRSNATSSEGLVDGLTQNLDESLSTNRFREAADLAFQMNLKNPQDYSTRVKGAYALFQLGLSNSAMILLKDLPPSAWNEIPQGQDRFVEIVSLFQKKVPLTLLPGRLDQMNDSSVPSFLKDEVLFAKGRAALERQDGEGAKALLNSISMTSGFYIRAKYLLATLALQSQNLIHSHQPHSSSGLPAIGEGVPSATSAATGELLKIFETNVFQQSSEFWKDMGVQVSSHWGTSLQVNLGTDVLTENVAVGELALLALARLAYADRSFEVALTRYDKVPASSPYHSKAQLEKIWTLLSLNRHSEAVELASTFPTHEGGFEFLEAKILRALVLTDSHRAVEAREALEDFMVVFSSARQGLEQYLALLGGASASQVKSGNRESGDLPSSPPTIIEHDFSADQRLNTLQTYSAGLKAELSTVALAKRSNPGSSQLDGFLKPRLEQRIVEARAMDRQLRKEHILQRLKDLDRFFMTSRLILAETYLDEKDRAQNGKKKKLDLIPSFLI